MIQYSASLSTAELNEKLLETIKEFFQQAGARANEKLDIAKQQVIHSLSKINMAKVEVRIFTF